MQEARGTIDAVGKLLASLALASLVAAQSNEGPALREGADFERAGNTVAALEAYGRAVNEAPAASRRRADALMAMARLQSVLGSYADARSRANEAAVIFSGLRDLAGVATARNRAGLGALYAGDYAAAEHDFKAAADLSIGLGDDAGRAEQISNLANVYFFVGRYADAARLYDAALAVTTASASEPWAARQRRIILANQASLYQRLGRDQQALGVYEELGASRGDLKGREHAQLLVNLGVLYRRLGDPIKALTTYDQARALFARDHDVDGELGVLKNRGIVLANDLGRLDAAERNFSDALTTATRVGNRREMLHARLYRGETILRAGDRDRARTEFAGGLSLSQELHTPEEEWKALYGLGRTTPGAEGIEYLSRAVSTIEAVRENIRVPSLRSEFLNDKREVYDALIRARLSSAPVGDLFNLLERSHSRGWRERLGLQGSVDLAAIQRTIAPDVLLLDYWSSPIGSAVIAVTQRRAAVIPIDVDAGHIKLLIDTLASGAPSTWRTSAQAISRLLPPPDWFAGIAHVIIVPDGAVALVPFELLQLSDRLLIEQTAVSYTPTAATLLRAAPARQRVRPPWRLQLQAFADPAFATAALDEGWSRQGRLIGAEEEVRRIASELAGRTVFHIGADDRKEYLRASGNSAPILHLATHAVADTTAIDQSRILFSSPDGSGGADYLFLKEAYELPLDHVELAVLSACDTERGQMLRGEGVQSFSRAFLAAGARSTVTTLWRVPDRATADFMALFYHALQQGVPRDEALRRAKLRFLQSGTSLSDPHYWAAFVVTGDALRPVARSIAWTTLGAGTAGCAALATLTIFGIRHVRRRA